jgi:hypothetical protein
MERLKFIVNRCKGEVSITINEHKSSYMSVSEYFEHDLPSKDDVDDLVLKEMRERDTIIRVQFYPDTPIGFHVVFHYDVDEALKKAREIILSD